MAGGPGEGLELADAPGEQTFASSPSRHSVLPSRPPRRAASIGPGVAWFALGGDSELDPAVGGRRGHELEQAGPFGDKVRGLVVGQRLERVDDEDCGLPAAIKPPLAPNEAVDQERAQPTGQSTEGSLWQDPASVVVREQ